MAAPVANMTSSAPFYENFVHAIAGAVAGALALATFYPLDTVRAILQIEDKRESKNSVAMIADIVKESGVNRLYWGLHPAVASIFASNFIYFYAYHGLQSLMVGVDSSYRELCNLVIAIVAGSITVIATAPLWVVNTRLRYQDDTKMKASWYDAKKHRRNYKGIIDCLVTVARDEGIRSLWNGTIPSLLLVLNPGIQFTVYELQKRHLQVFLNTVEMHAIIYFLMGAVAKMAATLMTYPLQILQSRFRYDCGSRTSVNPFSQSFLVLQQIFRDQGLRGLFKGLEAKLLQTILTAAMMFMCYEKISFFVFRVMGIESS